MYSINGEEKMLYDLNIDNFQESKKERNLYIKIFAGCLFNELIPDNNLPYDFLKLLKNRYIETCSELTPKIIPKKIHLDLLDSLIDDAKDENVHTMFDYHINQFNELGDRGELADILISGSNYFVAIEAKREIKWEFIGDVLNNRIRIGMASDEKQGIQVLLVLKKDWENRKDYQDYEYVCSCITNCNFGKTFKRSLYAPNPLNPKGKYVNPKLDNYYNENINKVDNIGFVVMSWEDINDVIKNKIENEKKTYLASVCKFLERVLNFNDIDYCPYGLKTYYSHTSKGIEKRNKREKGDSVGLMCTYLDNKYEVCGYDANNAKACAFKQKLDNFHNCCKSLGKQK